MTKMEQSKLNSNCQSTVRELQESEMNLLLTRQTELLSILEQSEKARSDWQSLAEELQNQLDNYLQSDQGHLQNQLRRLLGDNAKLRRDMWLMMIKLRFEEQKCNRFEKNAIENRNNRNEENELWISI